jgi:hypothetical protein
MVPLVVILGAGASRGSGQYRPSSIQLVNQPLVPPLTVDLFDERRYDEVLSRYDLAHQAGRFLNEQMGQDDALGLEHALHSLKHSAFDHHKHMAMAVPPYLQELLHQVSEDRYTQAVHYDRLIEQLLRLECVFFVSLNYDVLLDRRLDGHHQLWELEDYLGTSRNWSLIKPHGSVNWSHLTTTAYLSATPPIDLSVDRSTFFFDRPTASLQQLRPAAEPSASTTSFYPALAMPEGPDDTLVLPGEHRKFFLDSITAARKIDILVIGYSGLDRQILDLIASAGCEIRHMTIVNQDEATAEDVFRRFEAAGLKSIWRVVADADFATWSSDGGLNLLVEEYDGPYSRSV